MKKEKTVAEWVALTAWPAGLFTDTLPSARAFYLPLVAHQGTVGVLGLRPCQKKRTTPDLMTLAETFARQLAVGIRTRNRLPVDPANFYIPLPHAGEGRGIIKFELSPDDPSQIKSRSPSLSLPLKGGGKVFVGQTFFV